MYHCQRLKSTCTLEFPRAALGTLGPLLRELPGSLSLPDDNSHMAESRQLPQLTQSQLSDVKGTIPEPAASAELEAECRHQLSGPPTRRTIPAAMTGQDHFSEP